MTCTALARITALATVLAGGAAAFSASAQTPPAPTTPAAPMGTPSQSVQPGQPGTMGGMGMGGMGGMMGHMSGMNRGMTGGGHMMKIMFAIADTNGDGALSFDEVMAIHKRIFDAIDANKDGKVTPEELQRFMQQP
jgi:EF hand